MSEYQRFVSYIYNYEKGVKGNNVGYVRVEVKKQGCKLSLYLGSKSLGNKILPVYLFYRNQEKIIPGRVGEIQLRGGRADGELAFPCHEVPMLSCSFSEIRGVIIPVYRGKYFATQWDEEAFYLDEDSFYEKSGGYLQETVQAAARDYIVQNHEDKESERQEAAQISQKKLAAAELADAERREEAEKKAEERKLEEDAEAELTADLNVSVQQKKDEALIEQNARFYKEEQSKAEEASDCTGTQELEEKQEKEQWEGEEQREREDQGKKEMVKQEEEAVQSEEIAEEYTEQRETVEKTMQNEMKDFVPDSSNEFSDNSKVEEVSQFLQTQGEESQESTENERIGNVLFVPELGYREQIEVNKENVQDFERQRNHSRELQSEIIADSKCRYYEQQRDRENRLVLVTLEEFENWYPEDTWDDFLRQGLERFGHVLMGELNGTSIIGVPGMLYPRERAMASRYGYEGFYPKNGGMPRRGIFGYWYKTL